METFVLQIELGEGGGLFIELTCLPGSYEKSKTHTAIEICFQSKDLSTRN